LLRANQRSFEDSLCFGRIDHEAFPGGLLVLGG
jgi:hypothetical protein